MEAIAAVAFACNVLQLVHYATSTSKTIIDIHQRGSTTENDHLEDLGKQLGLGARQLEQYLCDTSIAAQQNSSIQEIKAIATDLQNINAELQRELGKLQRNGPGIKGIAKGFVKTIVRRNPIQELAKRLDNHRKVLSLRIDTDLWQRITSYVTNQEVSALVDSLRFAEMNQRINQIDLIADESFEWILSEDSFERCEGTRDDEPHLIEGSLADRSDSNQGFGQGLANSGFNRDRADARSNFQSWLQQDSGIQFWINGKAGCGKSTLMKKIWDHQGTVKMLELHHEPLKACILRYSFWLSGSQQQRSLNGLLCSLLHQLLTSYPILAQSIIEKDNRIAWKRDPHDWSVPDLQSHLVSSLAKAAHILRVCIFIDGLDECHPQEQNDLSAFLEILIRAHHAKVCVASRPEPLWMDRFQSGPRLRLQDLTALDIQRYVTQHLGSPGFIADRGDRRFTRKDLVSEIVNRAEGVFLWARTVTGLLVRGIRSAASWTELRDRLCQMPSEMGDLYEDMLSRLGPDLGFTKAEVALYLRMCLLETTGALVATDALAANLLLAMQRNFEKRPNVYAADDFEKRRQDMQHRISNICTGLLEISRNHRLYAVYDCWQEPKECILPPQNRLQRIQFSHRTVYDFLTDTPAGQKMLANCVMSDEAFLDTIIQTALLWWQFYSPYLTASKVEALVDLVLRARNARHWTKRGYMQLTDDCIASRLYVVGQLSLWWDGKLPTLSSYRILLEHKRTEHPLASFITFNQSFVLSRHHPSPGRFSVDCFSSAIRVGLTKGFDDLWDMVASTPEISYRYASYLLFIGMYASGGFIGTTHLKLIQAGASLYTTFSFRWTRFQSFTAAHWLLNSWLRRNAWLKPPGLQANVLALVQEEDLKANENTSGLMCLNDGEEPEFIPLNIQPLIALQGKRLLLSVDISNHLVKIRQCCDGNATKLQLVRTFLSNIGKMPNDQLLTYIENGQCIVPSVDIAREIWNFLQSGSDFSSLDDVRLPESVWRMAKAEFDAATEMVDLYEYLCQIGHLKHPADPCVVRGPIPSIDPVPKSQEEQDALIARISDRFRAVESAKQAGTYNSNAPKPRIWFSTEANKPRQVEEEVDTMSEDTLELMLRRLNME